MKFYLSLLPSFLCLYLAGCATVRPPSYDRYELVRAISYPDKADVRGIGGKITVRVTVDRAGVLTSTQVLEANDSVLADAVRSGVAAIHFRPATEDNVPIDGSVDMSVWFEPSPVTAMLSRREMAAVIWTKRRMPTDTLTKSGADLSQVPPRDDSVHVDVQPTFDFRDLARSLRYPEDARRQDVEGKVDVACYIDSSGQVLKLFVDASTDPIFNTVALETVQMTKFHPAMVDNKPIGVWMTIPIVFRLKK